MAVSDAGLGPVHVIESADLAALCSDVPDGDLVGRRRELKAHADVLSAACVQATVVPFSFGTVLSSRKAVLTDLLDRHAEHLRSELHRLGGLVQFNVRLVPDEQSLLADVVAGSPEIARLRTAVQAAGPSASQAQQMRLGEAASRAYLAAADRIGRIMVDTFAQHAVDTVVEEVGGPDGSTRAAFLVDRGQVTAFLDEAQRFAEGLQGRVTCRVTGPLPALSFVERIPDLPHEAREASWVS
jgi:hypothetical protein